MNVNVQSDCNNVKNQLKSNPNSQNRRSNIIEKDKQSVSPGLDCNNKQVSQNLNSGNALSKSMNVDNSKSRFNNKVTGNTTTVVNKSLNLKNKNKMSGGRGENIVVKRSTLFSKINELDEMLKK